MTLVWRSLQYVPAHVEKYAASPRILEADAVILDLQDSVPAEAKEQARAMATATAPVLAGKGPDILVRINEGEIGRADLDAVAGEGVRAIVVPNVRTPDEVRELDRRLTELETLKGLDVGTTGLLILVESAAGSIRMADIAQASPRILAMNLGNEDLARDLGVEPDEVALALPRQLMVLAAAAAGVTPLGLLGSGAGFQDLEAYRALAERSRRAGSRGSSCIHPSQIAVLNAVFSPSEEERLWAERVLKAAEDADPERGAFALEGRMIDAPILGRARNVLERVAAIQNRRRRTTAMSV
jgi:citrate lyase subunit beta/citryl-CoA lyase